MTTYKPTSRKLAEDTAAGVEALGSRMDRIEALLAGMVQPATPAPIEQAPAPAPTPDPAPQSTPGGAICSLTIEGRPGGHAAGAVVSFGHVFADGDLPA
ncbi:hypothetical protein, partial [Roseomonas indoligenes]